jgi:hypothetical protein
LEDPDSLECKTVRILFSELKSIRAYQGGQQLIFTQKNGATYVAFFQLLNAKSFLNSLKIYIKFVKSKKDKHLYLVFDEVNSVLNKAAELDIFQEDTSYFVWKYVKNLHNYPYETTMEAFSKLADVWC